MESRRTSQFRRPLFALLVLIVAALACGVPGLGQDEEADSGGDGGMSLLDTIMAGGAIGFVIIGLP